MRTDRAIEAPLHISVPRPGTRETKGEAGKGGQKIGGRIVGKWLAPYNIKLPLACMSGLKCRATAGVAAVHFDRLRIGIQIVEFDQSTGQWLASIQHLHSYLRGIAERIRVAKWHDFKAEPHGLGDLRLRGFSGRAHLHDGFAAT